MDRIQLLHSFVRVVETGSFSAVAREESTTQATISKRIAALEQSISARLLIRGSRKHTLTETGQAFYERAVNILEEFEAAHSEARALTAMPKGHLRVTVPAMFGNLYVAPVLPEFLSMYPQIQLDLKFSEKMLDLVEGGIDVAVRLGFLEDSSMVARKLGSDRLILVASPEYLAKHSSPACPQELKAHNCIVYTLSTKGAIWSFTDKPPETSVYASGNFQCDTGSGMMEMLLAGAGISFMPTWLVCDQIKSGKLVHILPDYYREYPISAVYPHRRYVPLKTKCFIDFIAKTIKTNPKLT